MIWHVPVSSDILQDFQRNTTSKRLGQPLLGLPWAARPWVAVVLRVGEEIADETILAVLLSLCSVSLLSAKSLLDLSPQSLALALY